MYHRHRWVLCHERRKRYCRCGAVGVFHPADSEKIAGYVESFASISSISLPTSPLNPLGAFTDNSITHERMESENPQVMAVIGRLVQSICDTSSHVLCHPSSVGYTTLCIVASSRYHWSSVRTSRYPSSITCPHHRPRPPLPRYPA